MIPHTLVLEPDLRFCKIYNEDWLLGRPMVEELRLDVRAVLQRCQPDGTSAIPDIAPRGQKGNRALFHQYGKAQLETLRDES